MVRGRREGFRMVRLRFWVPRMVGVWGMVERW